MADKALENAEMMLKQAIERKKALQAELLSLDDSIGHITRFIKSWHLFAEVGDVSGDHIVVTKSAPVENKPLPTHTDIVAKKVKNSPKEDVANAARAVIQERGEPVSRGDLYKELVGRGLTIEGKDPEMVLSTMLWRMKDRIARVKGGGYWLAEIPFPDAGYNPETATDFDNVLHKTAHEILDPESEEYREISDAAD